MLGRPMGRYMRWWVTVSSIDVIAGIVRRFRLVCGRVMIARGLILVAIAIRIGRRLSVRVVGGTLIKVSITVVVISVSGSPATLSSTSSTTTSRVRAIGFMIKVMLRWSFTAATFSMCFGPWSL